MVKKYLTEKELIRENNCNLHLIESTVFNRKYTLEEFSEIIPGMVHINNIDDLAINFLNSYGEEKLEATTEEILKIGAGFVQDLYEPGSLELFSQPLIHMVKENDQSKVISFFQKLKPNRHVDYKWVLTTSKILKDKNEFISISQELSGIDGSIKAINNLLEDNLYLRKNIEKFGILTKREKEILKLVAQGHSTKQIADILFLSHHTVTTHRRNITQKLNLKCINDWERFANAFNL